MFSREASHGLQLGETRKALEGQGPDLRCAGGGVFCLRGPRVLSGVVSFPRFLWFFTEAVWRQRRYRAERLHPGWLRTQLASAGAAVLSPVKGATRLEHLDPAFLLEWGSGRGGWGALGVVPGVDSATFWKGIRKVTGNIQLLKRHSGGLSWWSIAGQGTKIPCAVWCSQKKKFN